MAASDLYTIRLSQDDDADLAAINRLELSCAQGTEISFCFQSEKPRSSKFDESIFLLAESKGDRQVVGCFGGNIRSVQFQPGQFKLVSLVYGLRIDPKHRRSGLAMVLIKELEKRLIERGVEFAYCGTWSDNVPSFSLFQKAGYTFMFGAPFRGANVVHNLPLLPPDSYWKRKQIETRKLDLAESDAFIAKHFSKTFMYPDTTRNPIKSHVYLANKINSSDYAALVLCQVVDEWNFVSVSLKYRLYCLLLAVLNFFFPTLIEKPLPLGSKWRIYWAVPFAYETKSDPANFEPLIRATMSLAIKDMSDRADVIAVSMTHQIGNIADDLTGVAERAVFVSPTIFGKCGTRFLGKTLNTVKGGDDLLSFAKQKPFWFLDGKEI